jgi:hypothetical protein
VVLIRIATASLLLTPLDKAVIPPPMCQSALTFPAALLAAALAPGRATVVGITLGGVVYVSDAGQTPLRVGRYAALASARQAAFIGDGSVAVLGSSHEGDAVFVLSLAAPSLLQRVALPPGDVLRVVPAGAGTGHALLLHADGRVSRLSTGAFIRVMLGLI